MLCTKVWTSLHNAMKKIWKPLRILCNTFETLSSQRCFQNVRKTSHLRSLTGFRMRLSYWSGKTSESHYTLIYLSEPSQTSKMECFAMLSAVNYLRRKFHFRCLTRFKISLNYWSGKTSEFRFSWDGYTVWESRGG